MWITFSPCSLSWSRYITTKDHRGSRGRALLHQVPGVSSGRQEALLWRNPDSAAVGGDCCPLLETVRTATCQHVTQKLLKQRFIMKLFHAKMRPLFYCIWINRASVIQVVLSEHSLAVEEGFEQVYNASRVYSHFAYNPKTFNNDILLIKVRNIVTNTWNYWYWNFVSYTNTDSRGMLLQKLFFVCLIISPISLFNLQWLVDTCIFNNLIL